MPEGRRRFELGYSPPGGLPGGHNPELQADPQDSYITRLSVNELYEMHPIRMKGVIDAQNQKALSAKESRFESHRTMCRRGMHERPDIITNLKQGRVRFPAKQLYQQRDLRHGCQGSIAITNPIMEE